MACELRSSCTPSSALYQILFPMSLTSQPWHRRRSSHWPRHGQNSTFGEGSLPSITIWRSKSTNCSWESFCYYEMLHLVGKMLHYSIAKRGVNIKMSARICRWCFCANCESSILISMAIWLSFVFTLFFALRMLTRIQEMQSQYFQSHRSTVYDIFKHHFSKYAKPKQIFCQIIQRVYGTKFTKY